MMISFRRVTFLAAVVAAFAGGLLWNGKASVSSGLVSTAEARVGRPLTPMSLRRSRQTNDAPGGCRRRGSWGRECLLWIVLCAGRRRLRQGDYPVWCGRAICLRRRFPPKATGYSFSRSF